MPLYIVTISEKDLENLSNRFGIFRPELNFSSIENLRKSIKLVEADNAYKFSDSLSISYGFINGVEQVFMHGDGYGLSSIFGEKRVYHP